MPAFEALLSPAEIEQVVDYTIFLSMRGETELGLIDEAAVADEKDPDPLPDDVVNDIASSVFNKWKAAESQVLNPPVPRRPPDPREHPPRPGALRPARISPAKKVECT